MTSVDGNGLSPANTMLAALVKQMTSFSTM
jgi:hypothetical protein